MPDQHLILQNRGSFLFGLSLLLASVVTLMLSSKTAGIWPQLIGPVIVTLSGLYWLRLLYLWQRAACFERRERRRTEHPAERLEIPAGVKKLEEYEGAKILHDAQWTYIGRAVEAQGNYFANGILVAILPPLALLLLSLQLFTQHDDPPSPWAVGLILSEMACLVILVYLALTTREPTAAWIENRIRTELFRREQYLFLAGVGPYLLKKSSEAPEEALRRRGQIEGADANALVGLVPLQELSGLTWLEALHHRGSATLPTRSEQVERMESYLYYRIGKQLLWFANEIRELEENDRLWSRLLTGALLAAIGIAVLHAIHLYTAQIGGGTAIDGTRYSKVVIGALAIVLPPLATACISVRGMYNFRGRCQVYEHERALLYTHRGSLEALIQEARQAQVGATSRELDKIDFNFRAIALRTEQSLSVELAQWMLLMGRREHEVSA